MKKEKYVVITFPTTTRAMAFERYCKKEGREGRIIPLPPVIDAGCGLAWASTKTTLEEWEEYLKLHNLEYEKLAEVEF